VQAAEIFWREDDIMGVPYATAVEGGQLCGVCGVFVAEELQDPESHGNEGYWAHLKEVHNDGGYSCGICLEHLGHDDAAFDAHMDAVHPTPELRKVKIAKHLSEETTAFSAELWVKGKGADTLLAYVSNSGRGGNNSIRPASLNAFETWVRTQPPFINVDTLVDTLLDDYQEMQQVRRWCKTKTVVRLKDAPSGEYQIYKGAYSPALAAKIRASQPALEEIMNERWV
jgi:hypothetical protein